VIDAAATKPYGFMKFQPGPGLGGHCIPVDPTYLSWKMKSLNFTARFIELATDVNGHMPEHVVTTIGDLLNEERTAVNGARVLLLCVAYKADVSDLRESPALDVLRLLDAKGADLRYHDHFVPELALEASQLEERRALGPGARGRRPGRDPHRPLEHRLGTRGGTRPARLRHPQCHAWRARRPGEDQEALSVRGHAVGASTFIRLFRRFSRTGHE
jgi:hypothetical protein